MTDSASEGRAGDGGTAWRRIADALATSIEQGEYRPGDTLPASVALAEQYGVHRHTVRQAFRHLAECGLVTVSRGRGTQVTAPRFPYRIGRRVSLRTNFGAAGIGVSSSMLSATIVAGEPQHCATLGLPEGTPLWAIETLSRAGGTPVGTGLHYLEVERFPGFDAILIEAGASITAAFKASGIPDYVRRSTRLAARPATEREAMLLKLEPGAAVLQAHAVDALPDLTPIHLIFGAFAGERMEMVVEPFGDLPSPLGGEGGSAKR
ncbi:phosphonate metabolism transcriptional regulator PhnF [Bosea sp. (in: a-proteobacteria)]|uniref:phosphonate metabolism transcriptional regulator PhnF n=1 Tax=Bosea sp. (in: a-proteobacteria) TaxID=1871050 RepID=UPI002FCA70D9